MVIYLGNEVYLAERFFEKTKIPYLYLLVFYEYKLVLNCYTLQGRIQGVQKNLRPDHQ